MKLHWIRFWVQAGSFFLLTYGGRLGLKLGHCLPCFSCPYVSGCAGHCYLMALQGPFWGTQVSLAALGEKYCLSALGMFAGFALLTVIFSKTWCGWICPFGTLQDWIGSLRRKLGIREAEFSWKLTDRLKPVKYLLLFFLLLIPLLIGNAGLHSDFELPFCQLCPAKPLMPVFAGKFTYFLLDLTNPVTVVMGIISLSLTAFFLVGMFFRDRFFCLFCPLLALMSLFDRVGLIRFRKKVDACLGCGNCRRVCPVEVREVHDEKEKADVLQPECISCFRCVEACPQDNALSVRWLNRSLFSSARERAGKLVEKGKLP
ncbi:MAG: 4Fe-4S binding protein [Victivallaceae bacterium]|nr:4Fe-4S binding protein [Victivallaceae bacterium]